MLRIGQWPGRSTLVFSRGVLGCALVACALVACASGARSSVVAPPTPANALPTAEPPSLVVEVPETPAPEPSPPVAEPEPPKPIRHAFHEPLPDRMELAKGPAMELANLSPAACRTRLDASGLPVERHKGPAPGIALPLRLTGPLGDVEFRAPPARTPFGLLDCRLALVLAELSSVLAEHDVAQVRIDNFYRPKARLPGRKAKSQHAHGLAADVVEFVLRDGRTLNVERDWHGVRGEPPCGPEARVLESTDEAVRLRNLVCAVAARGLFHHILTPNYNAAHRDHLHLDVKRDAKWFGVH